MNAFLELRNVFGGDQANAPMAFATVAPIALDLKDAAVADAKTVKVVDSEVSQMACVAVLGNLKSLMKLTEDSRKQVKAPLLELERKIDSKAREFTSDLEAEVRRLSRLLSDYQAAEREKAEAAERARQAELARLAAIEATAKAVVASAAAAGVPVRGEDVKIAAEEAELRLMSAKAQRQELRAEPPVSAPRAAGLVVRQEWRFEVTDMHAFALWALQRGFDHLLQISPMVRGVRLWIEAGGREIPGVRIWQETAATVRRPAP